MAKDPWISPGVFCCPRETKWIGQDSNLPCPGFSSRLSTPSRRPKPYACLRKSRVGLNAHPGIVAMPLERLAVHRAVLNDAPIVVRIIASHLLDVAYR